MRRPIRAAARGIGAPRGPASLGAKLVLILTGIGLLGSLAIAVLLALVITPNFNRLEGQAVDGHVDRTRAALSEYAAKVENSVRDYGDWNSSYDYMAHQTRAFEQESFSPLAMANLDVEGMAYVASDGHIVIARWLDAQGATSPMATHGEALFRELGCSGCHGANAAVRAPPLEGLYGRAVALADGTRVIADDRYLRDSILLPAHEVVAGYAPIMPSFAGQVDEAGILDLIAYIRRLGGAEASR